MRTRGSRAPDDAIVRLEWEGAGSLGNREVRSVRRGEMRLRYWMFLFALPLLGYLSYRFFRQISAGFQVSFEHLTRLIHNLFYAG